MMGEVECSIRRYGVQNPGTCREGEGDLIKLLIQVTIDHVFLALRT